MADVVRLKRKIRPLRKTYQPSAPYKVERTLPGYDTWKTASPDDGYCEFCGIHERYCSTGWQPEQCTGECRRGWRDPDFEYDQMRDER